MKRLKLCWEFESIQLLQRGPDDFTVIYGKQIRSSLDYASAAKELGECLMHQLEAEGLL